MTLYCPRCGSQSVKETGHLVAAVERLRGEVLLIDYLDGFDRESLECQSCGHYDDDPGADWSRTLDEVRADELADWADNYNDERRLG